MSLKLITKEEDDKKDPKDLEYTISVPKEGNEEKVFTLREIENKIASLQKLLTSLQNDTEEVENKISFFSEIKDKMI